MPVYMDCNATTPLDPEVRAEIIACMSEEFGNPGSRTHEYGNRASQKVGIARERVAKVLGAKPDEVFFTSGATEANNLALLGLTDEGLRAGKRHVVSTLIEHKSVLEPLKELERRGFEITLVRPTAGGWVSADDVVSAVRDDTLVVSVMHVNNETGVVQPLDEIATGLANHEAYFHTDAAQGFGKDLLTVNPRIDLLSVSAHKVFGPMGVGALVARRRGHRRPPLRPLVYGGGQERGLRPGTIPAPLVAGFGLAAELAISRFEERMAQVRRFRKALLQALGPLNPILNGDQGRVLPHVLNLSILELDSEAALLALKEVVALSNGSACTSQSYESSHVLLAMGLPDSVSSGALRFSWCHQTEQPDWERLRESLACLCG